MLGGVLPWLQHWAVVVGKVKGLVVGAMMARMDPFSRPAEEGIFASFTPSSWVEVDEWEEIGEMVAERPHSADFAIAETSSGGHLPIHFQNRPALVSVQLQHHR